MPIRRIKRYTAGVRRELETTMTYVRLALSGNKIDRVTNFKQCRRPVLLLYGFGATRKVFTILEKRLRKDGFCVFSFNLGGMFDTFNTRCIEEMAEFVHQKVERLCKRYRLDKIDIIGHSKGGLIGHYYVKELGGARRVKTLITLGTPHRGNPLAVLGLFSPLSLFSKSIWQMLPLSPFIRHLNQKRWPKHVRVVSIFSKNDRVCPHASSRLEIPENISNVRNIELRGMTHADYVIRKPAYETMKKELLAAN